MKKVIAILSVLAIMACAFAANPDDSLKITAKVPSTEPVFKLEVTSGASGTPGAITYSGYNGATEADPTATGAVGGEIPETAKILENGATVNFKISQVGAARSNLKYQFLVSAEPLVLTTVTAGATPAANEKFDLSDTDIVITPDGTGLRTTGEKLDKVDLSDSPANPIIAQYSGKVAGSFTVGTFPVTWVANDEAIAGEYAAWVKLEIKVI